MATSISTLRKDDDGSDRAVSWKKGSSSEHKTDPRV